MIIAVTAFPGATVVVTHDAVDAFVLARLEKEGLQPSAEADRTTLRIESGGSTSYTDTGGKTWAPDAHFTGGELVCLDKEGKQVWSRQLTEASSSARVNRVSSQRHSWTIFQTIFCYLSTRVTKRYRRCEVCIMVTAPGKKCWLNMDSVFLRRLITGR